MQYKNKLFINGEWLDGSNKETFNVLNPASEEVLTSVASADVEASYGVPANSINSVSATPLGTTNKTDLLGFNYDLLQSNIELIIFEPHHQQLDGYNYIENFEEFAEKADLIIANRISDELTPYKEKVFTRDIFNQD